MSRRVQPHRVAAKVNIDLKLTQHLFHGSLLTRALHLVCLKGQSLLPPALQALKPCMRTNETIVR